MADKDNLISRLEKEIWTEVKWQTKKNDKKMYLSEIIKRRQMLEEKISKRRQKDEQEKRDDNILYLSAIIRKRRNLEKRIRLQKEEIKKGKEFMSWYYNISDGQPVADKENSTDEDP